MGLSVRFLAIIVVFFALYVQPASAALITIRALDYGLFVVMKNDAQYDLVVNSDGTYSFDAASFVELVPPQAGIYDIDGLTPNAAIVSITTSASLLQSGSGRNFEVVDIQADGPTTTSPTGVARILLGATVRTSGSFLNYTDEVMNGVIRVEVNY